MKRDTRYPSSFCYPPALVDMASIPILDERLIYPKRTIVYKITVDGELELKIPGYQKKQLEGPCCSPV